jgi:hypoxanthine phosphoribosyltransferase
MIINNELEKSVVNIPEDIQSVFAKATCIYSKAEVEQALDKMANDIIDKVSESHPIFLCAVVGGMIPLGGLLTRMTFPLEINYIHATRYQGATTGGELIWKAKPTCNLENRIVVIVDDILDTGLTLSAIIDFCKDRGAREIYTAVLVDKHHARQPGGLETADFAGLTVGDHYVFGYGMDYRGYLRNAPGIYAIAPEHS